MWGDVAIAFLLAFIVAFMATPYTRRMHKKAMPKFGGPAVILRLPSISCLFINCYEYGRNN